jgi:prepilin-type N-terminal cleavage/methylation domain-containing protein
MYASEGRQRGVTLIEVLIGVAIFAIVSGAVYQAYAGVVTIVTTAQYTSAAVSVIESRVEMVRNMRYQDVGTVGGVPVGLLPQTEEVALGSQSFTLTTTIRNIDDPFDGTVSGNPLDLNPADYKLVQFDMTCDTCARTAPLSMVTYVAPKTLENESRNGSMEISVIDASGNPVPQATLHVVNTHTSPVIDLTTTADNNGKLLLLSLATGSAVYEITASKPGYSSDWTWQLDNPANALKPHATVATQQLTLQTMVIDRVSTMTWHTQDRFCADVGDVTLEMTGGKLVGLLPDTPKNVASHSTDSGGDLTLSTVEWDTYTITPTDNVTIAGTTASTPITVDPNTTHAYTWTTVPKVGAGILVTITDESSQPLTGAAVSLASGSQESTQYAGWWAVGDSDWSDENYTEISPGLDITASGSLTLLEQGGAYATGSAQTLTSRTFDIGTDAATLHAIEWSPESQPSDTSVRLQIAGNNDNSTWNFVGPDGTDATYFETSGSATPPILNGQRYIRYRVFLETTNPDETPELGDVTIRFSSSCLAGSHAFFDGLASGASYTLTVQMTGYQDVVQSVIGPAAWSHVTIELPTQ